MIEIGKYYLLSDGEILRVDIDDSLFDINLSLIILGICKFMSLSKRK